MVDHIFLMQVHKDPGLFGRIISRLASQNHAIIVNVDAKTKNFDEFKAAVEGCPNIIFNDRVNVMHGGFSQIHCTLIQLKLAYDSFPNFKYLHTLSGQCYPCCTQNYFDKFFAGNTTSYLMMDTLEQVTLWRQKKYPHRLEHWYFMDVFNTPLQIRLHIHSILWRALYWIPRKYDAMQDIWGGWNWFSLHRSLLDEMCKFIDNNPSYTNRFKYTSCGDELFFTTIIKQMENDFPIETRNCLRFVDWQPKRAYSSLPLVLNENEYDAIANSGALFCRKVDSLESNKLLDMLDAYANKR